MLPATVNNIASGLSSDMQSKDQITSECNAQICDRTQDLVPSHVFLIGQPLDFDSEMPSNSGFETPSESFDFDLDLFSEMLKKETIPKPTDADLAAHAFLRTVLRK